MASQAQFTSETALAKIKALEDSVFLNFNAQNTELKTTIKKLLNKGKETAERLFSKQKSIDQLNKKYKSLRVNNF